MKREKLSLTAKEYRANPFEAFGWLREKGPIVPARLPFIGNMWLATNYASVTDVLKNDKLFCRDPKNAGRRNFWIFSLMTPLLLRRLTQNMISKDEPDHRRLRSLVDQAFHRQEVTKMQPRVEQIVDQQLDRIEQLASQGQSIDLVEQLARPVPLAVICEVLGLPDQDRPKFRKWFSAFANIKSLASIYKVVPGLWRTQSYLKKQIEQCRREPRAGLMHELVQAEADGDRLNDEELIAMVMMLLLAGHETTIHLLSSSILTLLQMPEVLQTLSNDWSLLSSTVDELLRYNSSAQFAKPRFVTEDVEFHGTQLKRGETIMPVLASANYDPAKFENPSEFQINRPDNHHLTFGFGPHVCLGLKVAKQETEVVLQRLFTRWPDLRANFDLSQPDWSSRLGMRSLSTLDVTIPDASRNPVAA